MFGRFGIVIIVAAALVCAGVFAGSEGFRPIPDMSFLPGVIVMIAALILSAAAPGLTSRLPDEKRQTADMLVRLCSVALCAVGALLVFCG